MERRTVMKGAILGAAALGLNSRAAFAAPPLSGEKLKVVNLLKAIETGDGAAVAAINPNQYKQHNLDVGEGLAGFGAVLKQLPPGSARVNTVRFSRMETSFSRIPIITFSGRKSALIFSGSRMA